MPVIEGRDTIAQVRVMSVPLKAPARAVPNSALMEFCVAWLSSKVTASVCPLRLV